MSPWDPNRSLAPPQDGGQPFFWDDSATEAGLAIAERVTQLRSSPLPAETVKSLRLWFRTQHVFHSNAIEGSTLTLYETQVVIGDGLTVGGRPLRDVLAAKNLATALDWVEDLAQKDEPINERTIREIHELVMRGEDGVLPGRSKTEDNRVAGAQFRTPSFLQTPPLMDALGKYLSSVHQAPVISSAVLHAWMVGIHPFRDGNGRTARLLANLVLIRHGQPVALLTEDRRPEYYSSLDQAHCTGDLTDFIKLWCSCVGTTLIEYERLSGALQTRERELEYMASAVKVSHSFRTQTLRQWQAAVDNLAGELNLMANALNAKIPAEAGRVAVTASQVTDSVLDQARSGMAPVIQLSGRLQGRPFSSHLSLGMSLQPSRPHGSLSIHVYAPRPSSTQRLVELSLDGPRLTFLWRSPDGEESQEEGKTFAEAANLIFKEAFERASGA